MRHTPLLPLHDASKQLQRREVVPTALILSITLALRQALTIERTKLFLPRHAQASCGIVHIFSPAPSLDYVTCKTISVLLSRTFRALLVAHVFDVFCSQVHDAAKVSKRSIKRVGMSFLVILYIHFYLALSHRNKYAYLLMQGGSCSVVRLPHLISYRS